jgi:hypothetical protein
MTGYIRNENELEIADINTIVSMKSLAETLNPALVFERQTLCYLSYI